MRYPWANIALLFLLIFQVITGFVGLITGSDAFQWILRLHDIGGYAVLVLLCWKGVIVVDAFRRQKRLNLARIAFVILTILLLVTLTTGLVWPVLGYFTLYGFSLMTSHALLTLALIVFLTWHTLARQYVFRSPQLRGRRALLQFLGVSLAGFFFWQFGKVAEVALKLPGRNRRFTGSYDIGSHTGNFPTVSWLFDDPAPINRETWRLTIDGEVDRRMTLTYDQLEQLATDSIITTVDCTGGWYSTQEWRGINFSRLLDMVGIKDTALSVTIEAISGYGRRFSLADARSSLLATEVGGQALDHGHGFPLRLVAPAHRGFDWVKWVSHIHLNDTSEIWQPPVPLQ